MNKNEYRKKSKKEAEQMLAYMKQRKNQPKENQYRNANQVLAETLADKQRQVELQRERLDRIPDNVALQYKGINRNQSLTKWEMDYDFLMRTKKDEVLQKMKKEEEKEEQRKLNGFTLPFLPQFDKNYSIASYSSKKILHTRYHSLIKILDYTNQYKKILEKNKQQIQEQIDILNLQNSNISIYKKVLLSANTLEEASTKLKDQFNLENNEIEKIFDSKINELFGAKIDNTEVLNLLNKKLEEYNQLLISLNEDFNKIKEEFINLTIDLNKAIVKNQIFPKLREEVGKLCSYIKMFYIILNFESILRDYQNEESTGQYASNWDYNNDYLLPNLNDQIFLLEQNFSNEKFIEKILKLKKEIIAIFNNNWDDSFNNELIMELLNINLEMEQFFKNKFIKSETYLKYIKNYVKTIDDNGITQSRFNSINELSSLVQMKNDKYYTYYHNDSSENLIFQKYATNITEQIKKL